MVIGLASYNFWGCVSLSDYLITGRYLKFKISGIIMVFLHVPIHARTVSKPLLASLVFAYIRLFASMPEHMFLKVVFLRELLPTLMASKPHDLEVDRPKMPLEAIHTSISLITAPGLAVEPIGRGL